MASNGTNGTNGAEKPAHRFDPNFTQAVIDNMGPKTTPRNRQVLGALVRHLHDFTREVELTIDEWMAAVHFVNAVGRIYSESKQTRNEAHRICDILGLESLVDEIAHKVISEGDIDPTSSSILGPFWSPNAPFRELGGTIIQDGVPPKGRVTKMHGVIRDMTTGKPIPGAVFDIWQASANGKYDFQDPENQTPNNLRGKFRADEEGRYWFYCLHPTAYSLPQDGPSWDLLTLMDRHPMRPAHIHIMVTHENFQGCTTQLYPNDDPWLTTDTVFAVKPDLVVDFKPLEGDDKAVLELEYNVFLAPKGYKGKL
ncbi:Intradiol ring-cleavage dioxygenase [Cercophora newfieldiana]|uniref:Intradiol ring-cleavage dioxygenase n=1 Tax=Cercophora newfieldiana TaxID=92897 RepID=A0AA40CKX7_9PEZI|nr:Intradiol ring-cleavage dioxygenase [Cercophora newfieldiana]